MKKPLLAVFMIALTSIVGFAQQDTLLPYTAETLTIPYEALTEWSPLNIDEMWDVPIVTLNLQFDFPCFGDTADIVRLTDIGGGIELYVSDNFHLLSATTCNLNDILNVADSTITEGSTHRYVTIGESPNRIFKLEFNNVGFDYEMYMTQTAASRANFQVWLYENGMIEYHFGPNTVSDISAIDYWPKQTAGISSYWDFFDFTGCFMWASGNAEDPEYPLFYEVEYDSLNISPAFDGLDAWPSDGRVYRYNYIYSPVIGVDEVIENALTLSAFPNPTHSSFSIHGAPNKEEWVSIFDGTGRLVHAEKFTGEITIDAANWAVGTYTITSPRYRSSKVVIN